MPSMFAAAVPDVAVTKRRLDCPIAENSCVMAAMSRDFPVPPSPPTNWQSWETVTSPRRTL